MRLIDADALKSAITAMDYLSETNLNFIYKAIDNAPTVEYPFYQEAYQTGYEEGKNERPQGEWKYIPEGFTHTNGWECSNCKMCYHTKVPYFGEFNFCPKCGAKMVISNE